MKKTLMTLVLAGAATAAAQTSNFQLGLTGGFSGGLGGEVSVHAPNLFNGLGLRATTAYTGVDAFNDQSTAFAAIGYPTFAAYKTGTNSTESGSNTTVGVDVTYGLGTLAQNTTATLYAGPRYNMFRGTITTPGATTTTSDYTTNQFGLGAGVLLDYGIDRNLSLLGDLGFDQFFAAPITSNGVTTQPGTDAYRADDNLVNQPGSVFKFKVGIGYRF
ncbi:hypothetical protein [Deinococcus maricopensis]|uniref:Outer membrane protein beta-barrel domain-containing protein n=1 Tax=Deinococcus maricopensis (strain DSM 21211 / LMG 22137 / NRRL B-23946 / LB-34) TaxID=709986 RepID=E8UAJ3_DEIML|nr:hypothetical protein [Deinococcus maricopensis]ADV68082.1 hypothetical protein Deima_2447 [Deinococcus maricopensis DSM 21211]